eukprot:GCRY01002677.1.p1 GENE.GCRY01002677.1~~GCRY01002677.1.p1  ORF type:complete len:280 (+),score=77.71 GCRY01002677.1:242-1081(+)
MEIVTEQSSVSPRKSKLYCKTWKAVNKVANLVFVHGLGEHIERYHTLFEVFATNGIEVFSWDQEGFGQSEGKPGATPWKTLMEDVDMFVKEKAKEDFPLFLYGHSMGGCIVLTYLLEHHDLITAAVASSPFIETPSPPSAFKVVMAKVLGSLIPNVTLESEMNNSELSRDAEIVKTVDEDPLCHRRISLGFGMAFLHAGETLKKPESAQAVKTPLMMAHGTADKICDFGWTKKFYDNLTLPEEKKLFYEVADARHELHNELEKELFVDTLLQWFKKFLP